MIREDNNLESVDERLAAINLDHRDLKWVAGFYRKGIKVASPCYFDGGLELEVSFANDHDGCGPDQIDLFLDRNGFNYSRSCGLARVINFKDADAYRVFFDKLGQLFVLGNMLSLRSR